VTLLRTADDQPINAAELAYLHVVLEPQPLLGLGEKEALRDSLRPLGIGAATHACHILRR